MDSTEFVEVGLVNNMPDSAFDATERQFRKLLAEALPGAEIRLRLLFLPGVPRSDWGIAQMAWRYASVEQMWDSTPDALIITGTEPRAADLRDEPYWGSFARLIDWAEDNAVPAVLSCLAAHAAVLHIDGVPRRRLAVKRFGVFAHEKAEADPLTDGLGSPVRIPHSRWNDVPDQLLGTRGWRVLTRSADGNVDMFTKRRRGLLLCLQGHPEYEPETLGREYRRDIRRYLQGTRDTYPDAPEGYFDPRTHDLLVAFRDHACAHRREETLAAFPEAILARPVESPWCADARIVFRNWLSQVCAAKLTRRPASRQYA